MYRAVLYGLYLMVATALGLSLFGQLSFTLASLIVTLIILLVVSYAVNRLFAWTFSVPHNPESWQITALIIFFLIFPQSDFKGYLYVGIIAAIAMASKFLLAIRGRHIFNPAAVAVVIGGLLGVLNAAWWVGTLFLLPVLLIVGFLLTWKLRHFWMVGAYMFVTLVTTTVLAKIGGHDMGEAIKGAVISGPMIFAGTIMLTEPLTSPTTKRSQIFFGMLVGALSGGHLGWISKPDVAILVGNVYAFMLGARRSISLNYVGTRELAPTIHEFLFKPEHRLKFKPGQYIELTLPHDGPDDRGIRRVFSIASRPGAEYLRLGLVMPETGHSTFKQALVNLETGTVVRATQIGGSFTLPRSHRKPLVLVAGGIGITPFRAMLDELTEKGEKRQVTLFYAVRRQELAVYTDIISQAIRTIGLGVVIVVSEPSADWTGETGRLTVETIAKYAPDLADSKIYISGPNAMVQDFQRDLRTYAVSPGNIVTDYFTGY
jgi:ferredoxin-NADP reductase/Na+-translocating ferredoxin:NAD+ oxidoreductase RnfD subunit